MTARTLDPMPDRESRALVPRTLRVDPDTWRAAAARARQDGRGLAEIVGAFLTAYAAGELDAPPTAGTPWTRERGQTTRTPDPAPPVPTVTPHPDAWHCLACRAEEVRQGAGWLEAPCPDHPPTTITPTPTPTGEDS